MSKLTMSENNHNDKARILNRIDLIGKLEETEKNYNISYDPELKKIKVYGIFDEKIPYNNLLLFHASDVIKYLKGSTENKKWFIKNFRQPVELIQINISIPLDNHTKPLKCNLLTMCGVLRAVNLCGIETDNRKINKNKIVLSNLMSNGIMEDTLEYSFDLYNYFNNSFEMNLHNYIYPDKTLDNLYIEMDSNDIEDEIKESDTNHIKVEKIDNTTQTILDLPVETQIEPTLKIIECNNISEKELHKQFSALLLSAIGLILLITL